MVRKAHKYWKGLENTISESKKIMEEQGVDILPTQKELIELGYSCLNIAISRYHGGFHNFREKHLGEEVLRKPSGYYTLENTISESKKVMEEHGFDTLPSSNKLRELGYSGLSRAISIHHGGFPNFRKTLNWNSKSNAEHLTDLLSGDYPSLEDYIKVVVDEKEESNKITLKPLYSLGYLQKKTDFGNK